MLYTLFLNWHVIYKTKNIKNVSFGVRHDSIAVKVLALHVLESHMVAGSNPSIPASHPAPCLSPGKAVEDGLEP